MNKPETTPPTYFHHLRDGTLLDAAADRFGRLDILINNAGTFVERDFSANADATKDIEQEIALNLTAPIQLTGEVLN